LTLFNLHDVFVILSFI